MGRRRVELAAGAPVTVTISGASDDLVEVQSDAAVPGCDEYSAYNTATFVHLSTGHVFKVEYGERGVWTVRPYPTGWPQVEPLAVETEPAGDGDDPEPYTETVTVTGPIRWVEAWPAWPPTPEQVLEKVRAALDDRLDAGTAPAVYAALFGRPAPGVGA